MATQNVANNPLGSYPVLVTKVADQSQVQSINAILPFISNKDDNGAGTVYIGYALRGAADSAGAWFILKQVTSGNVTSIKFASSQNISTKLSFVIFALSCIIVS